MDEKVFTTSKKFNELLDDINSSYVRCLDQLIEDLNNIKQEMESMDTFDRINLLFIIDEIRKQLYDLTSISLDRHEYYEVSKKDTTKGKIYKAVITLKQIHRHIEGLPNKEVFSLSNDHYNAIKDHSRKLSHYSKNYFYSVGDEVTWLEVRPTGIVEFSGRVVYYNFRTDMFTIDEVVSSATHRSENRPRTIHISDLR